MLILTQLVFVPSFEKSYHIIKNNSTSKELKCTQFIIIKGTIMLDKQMFPVLK